MPRNGKLEQPRKLPVTFVAANLIVMALLALRRNCFGGVSNRCTFSTLTGADRDYVTRLA
jgi:hypothetical protein